MATTIYHGPTIWIGLPGEQTWWFHHGNWKPGDWLRASMNARHSPSFDGCDSFEASVEILQQWTETKTIEDCGDLRSASVALVHWVRFKVTRVVDPRYALEPLVVLPRFAVHT